LETEAPLFAHANDERVTNRKGNVNQNAASFIATICDLLVKAYYNLLDSMFERLDSCIDKAIFDVQGDMNAGVLSPDGGVQMQHLLLSLNHVKDTLTKRNLDARIINHAFDCVSQYIDAYVFNTLIKNAKVNTSKALQIKMSMSVLEGWFEQNDIKVASSIDSMHKFFRFSRQSADVCVIAQKELLTDESMRSIVCPSLSVSQIGYLLSNFNSDDNYKSQVPANVLQQLKQIEGDITKLYVKPVMDITQYCDVKSGNVENGMLFYFGKLKKDLLDMGELVKLQVPSRFAKRKEFKFLNELKA